MGHGRSLAGDNQLRLGAYLLLPFFLLSGFWAALRVARRQKAEIIHAHWVIPGGLTGALVARILGIPLAVSLHGSDIFVAQQRRQFGWVAGWVFERAAVVTACSQHLRKGALRLGAAPDRVHLVAWGADPERFHPGVPTMDRSRVGLSPDDVILVALGRIVPKKGFDVLVRAMPPLVEAYPYVHLIIGGDGSQRAGLADLAVSLGIADHVHLPGRIPWNDVPAFLAMGDIFVLPSVRDASGNEDGLPTVLLEALSLGQPVVASRIGGVPLVVKPGENGILCPSGNTEALSQAIAGLVGDDRLRARLGEAARASVQEQFNWTEVAGRFAALFTNAVEQV